MGENLGFRDRVRAVFFSRHLFGRGIPPQTYSSVPQTAAKLCTLNLLYGQDNDLAYK